MERRWGQAGTGPRALGRRAAYRVRQFWQAVWAPLAQGVPKEPLQGLTPGEQALFWGMSPVGRRHGAAVAQTLLRQGYREHSLLAAALLHDVGKDLGGQVSLLHRVAIVLAPAFGPTTLTWLAERPWGGGFRVHLEHAEVGARLAEEAGADPQTVAWIRHHHEPPARDDPLRLALWEADNVN